MTVTIYGVAYSRAISNIWACLELGIDYQNVPIGWDDEGNTIYSEAYRAINPNQRVPALADGEFVLWESLAINGYLVKKAGGPLAPRDLREDAKTMQWSLWAAIHLERTLVQWAFHTFILDPEERKPEVAAKAWAELQPLFRVLDGALADRPYLLGDRFSLADLNVGCTMFRPRRQLDLAAWPRLKDWDSRVFDRPAARRAWEIRAAAAAA
jgi:glutathione S-transferase